MKAHVNELLLYARLPFHFWTELKGGRWPFDNPGCSVMSLCAHKLNQQMITVPPEVAASLEECREFTTDAANVSHVMQWVESTSEALVVKANSLNDRRAVFHELTHLLGSIKNLRSLLSTIFSGVNPPAKLDLEQELTLMFLQSLIDVKADMEQLGAAVINASTPTSPAKA
jgi:hypothetical protein